MDDLLAQCKWPALSERHDIALRAAVEFILENHTVAGIIASGTIIRGNPDPTSDLDIYVIHMGPYRQRVQRFFNDIPTEIFINPPRAIHGYFEDEQATRNPITAHMLATGFVILNLDPVVNELREQAKSLLSQPPAAPEDMTTKRYMIALLYEDALDIVETDPVSATMILNQVVAEMLRYCFIRAGCFIPRKKSLLTELAGIDAGTADLARRFYLAPSFETRVALAGLIADRTVEARGFFEWENPPEILV